MKRGQPSECDRYSAGRRRRPGGARYYGGVALLMALSVPAVAALKAFDIPDVTAPAAVRTIEAPPKPAQLMAAADRLERLSAERRPVAGSFIKAEAAPAAEAPDKSWTERARDAYERVVVPALSGAAAPESTTAGQTAQTEPAKPQADDAVVPPVKREMPVTPPAQDQPAAPTGETPAATSPTAKPVQEAPAAATKNAATPATTPDAPAAASPSLMDRVQDWLARSNRDYQGTIVKGLSTPSTAPAGGEDAIAKKIEETKAAEAAKAAEDAAKKAQAEKTAEAAKAAEADKKAADAKAREQKQIEDARRKAEETKRLADEASKKADEILKLEAEKSKAAAPQKAETPKADDAERQRREAERQAEETKRAEAARKAEAARQAEADRKAEAAQAAANARAAEEARRRAVDAAQADKHRTRTVVLTPEPIVRPAATPTYGRPERSNGYRSTYVQDTAYRDAPVRQRLVIYSETRSGRIRGTAVKRWIWRTHAYTSRTCRYAGRRITPPARYTVARGDSLWRISAKHYNRGSKYPRIYRANRSIIHDPDLIYPCQRFKIPRRR